MKFMLIHLHNTQNLDLQHTLARELGSMGLAPHLPCVEKERELKFMSDCPMLVIIYANETYTLF